MPNWCFTDYIIEGAESEISDLFDKLNSLSEREDAVQNGFGKFWLGNVVALFGGDCKKINCRGKLLFLDNPSPTQITFLTETAWVDMPEVWEFALKQYPNLKLYYSAEESGCDYYSTNDNEGKHFNPKHK